MKKTKKMVGFWIKKKNGSCFTKRIKNILEQEMVKLNKRTK